jgi:hypothetical protein
MGTHSRSLRDRLRQWRTRPERLADLSTPLPHERAQAICTACSAADEGPCRCVADCGHLNCTGGFA